MKWTDCSLASSGNSHARRYGHGVSEQEQFMDKITAPQRGYYELRFQSLFNEGRGWAFPCDAQGRVDLDHLSDRARSNYFFARTVIGREVAFPSVQPVS